MSTKWEIISELSRKLGIYTSIYNLVQRKDVEVAQGPVPIKLIQDGQEISQYTNILAKFPLFNSKTVKGPLSSWLKEEMNKLEKKIKKEMK